MIFSCALLRSRDVTVLDQGRETKLDLLGEGDLLVLDEAVLLEVLVALLFLLRLVVGLVGDVAPGGVAVLALNDVVILGLLGHDDLVHTPLTSSGNGADVKSGFVIPDLLSAGPGVVTMMSLVTCMMVVMVMIVSVASPVEWEGVS